VKPASARRPGAGETPPGPGEIERRIRAAISADHGIQVAEVVLAVPGSVPKTSSGKLQRRACRAAYEQGTLQRAPRALSARPLSGEGR
jgi:acyl-CoA synthetase (AMP-forming)/AMP-acid ligase II